MSVGERLPGGMKHWVREEGKTQNLRQSPSLTFSFISFHVFLFFFTCTRPITRFQSVLFVFTLYNGKAQVSSPAWELIMEKENEKKRMTRIDSRRLQRDLFFTKFSNLW